MPMCRWKKRLKYEASEKPSCSAIAEAESPVCNSKRRIRRRRHRQRGTPKAGVFAEGAAKAVATSLVSRIRGEGEGSLYGGAGSCYIEFGAGRIGRVDVDFFPGPNPTGTYYEPDVALRADKLMFGASRKARWFGT